MVPDEEKDRLRSLWAILYKRNESYALYACGMAAMPVMQKEKGLQHCAATLFMDGRSKRIRTFDLLVPNETRYQAAPYSEEIDYSLGFW
jgi:hypothetical protein